MDERIFSALQKKEKLRLTNILGQYIGTRGEENYYIHLYQLHSFYVELFCHKQKSRIEKVHSFTSTDELIPYLEKIDIKELME